MLNFLLSIHTMHTTCLPDYGPNLKYIRAFYVLLNAPFRQIYNLEIIATLNSIVIIIRINNSIITRVVEGVAGIEGIGSCSLFADPITHLFS